MRPPPLCRQTGQITTRTLKIKPQYILKIETHGKQEKNPLLVDDESCNDRLGNSLEVFSVVVAPV